MIKDKQNFPAKVHADRLREHFRTTYNLSEEQIDMMLGSTAKSLNSSFSALYRALDNDADLSEISRLGHSIKGLLLNMGEFQWAEFAKEIEHAAAHGEKIDYRGLVDNIHYGVEDIL